MQAQEAAGQVLWEASPSQWLNFRTYFLGGLVFLMIVAAAVVIVVAPSQQLQGPFFQSVKTPALIALGVLLLMDLFFVLRAYLRIRCTRYTVTPELVRLRRGILSRRTDNLELYRVDDILLMEPLLLRLVRRGTVVLLCSDRTNPQLLIEAVPKPAALRDYLRQCVESCRDRKRTRVVDFS